VDGERCVVVEDVVAFDETDGVDLSAPVESEPLP
jgi:hypothetical protein